MRRVRRLDITHDVGLAWALCDRVAVMYLGRIIEQGTTEQVLADPRHPYTQALLSVVPSPIPRTDGKRRTILEGELPDASRIPPPAAASTHVARSHSTAAGPTTRRS